MDDTQSPPLQRLFEFGVEFAQKMLAENGEFYPFGATVSASGEISGLGGDIGATEHPSQEDVYAQVSAALSETATRADVSAVALVANVILPDEFESPSKDAIRVQLEGEGFSRFIHVPYIVSSDETPVVELLEPILVDVEPMFFKAH